MNFRYKLRKKMIIKKQILQAISFALLFAFSLSLFACGGDTEQKNNGNMKNTETYNADCIIGGKEIFFVDDDTKKEWKAPLAKLLSNVLVPYGEGGDILGYEASVDPNAPVIPQSYRCGLLDITQDGVPELLVHPFGYHGSSGTSTYFVYNIYSGQKLGEIDGGSGESWCYYYYTETDELNLIGQYWLRCGWDWRDRYMTKVYYEDSVGECMEAVYLHTAHAINGEETDIVDEDPDDMFYTATWVESYPETTYYRYGQEVYLDDYYAEYDWFLQKCIRIPETELVLINWDDISDADDDYSTKGSKMADALISSDQEFIQPISPLLR